jgi:hypothetical protein
MLGRPLLVTHLTGFQEGQKRDVIRQDAEFSERPWGLDFINLLVEE